MRDLLNSSGNKAKLQSESPRCETVAFGGQSRKYVMSRQGLESFLSFFLLSFSFLLLVNSLHVSVFWCDLAYSTYHTGMD